MKFFKRLIIASLLLASAALLAFGPKSSEPVPPGKTFVEYWEKWGGDEATQMKQIVEQFNQTVGEQKHIFVRYLTQSEVDRKALVATAGGVPPDVVGVWDHELPGWAAMGALEPLDAYAAEHGITQASYKPVLWDTCTFEGHLYALVSTPGGTLLVWNKKVFQDAADDLRKAGCDPDRPPATIDEFDRYAQAIDQWGTVGGRRQLVRMGYHPLEPGWYIQYTPLWFGGQLFDDKSQELTLDSPRCIKAFEWVASYSDRLGVSATTDFRAGFQNFSSPQNPFLIGEVSMVQQGPWMPNYMNMYAPWMNHWKGPNEPGMPVERRKANVAWGAAAFPSAVGQKDVCFVGADLLCIPRTARHKKEAFEFIAFVNRQDVAEHLNSMHCKPSPLAKVSSEFILNHPNPYIDVFEHMLASPNAHAVPRIPIWLEVQDELTVASQRVFRHEVTAAQAMHDAQERMTLKWHDYRRMRTLHEQRDRT